MRPAIALMIFVMLVVSAGPSAIRAKEGESNSEDAPHYTTPGPRQSVEIGNFYFKRKKYAGALSRYKEAVKADPHYAPAYLGLGKVYEHMGLKQKALENYQQYLDELPSQKQADEATDVHKAMERIKKGLGSTPAKASRHR